MAQLWIGCAFVAYLFLSKVNAAPQAPAASDGPPEPYEYKYDVEDKEKELFFGANESGDNTGKVVGGYKVLLPDNRLQVVEYTVEGESGFVPKISYQDSPFGKKK